MADLTLLGTVRRTTHRGDDDLAGAGLGLAGVTGPIASFADPEHPTANELRRRAIQAGWKGLVDLGPLGGFGSLYGGVPHVPGREYSAFARLPNARQPFRVLCQVPDDFDAAVRCLVVAPASGSRGVYGATALGAWALAHGCAVAYTDKGAGSGYFDCADGTGVALDGTRAAAGKAQLDFEPRTFSRDDGIAVKHAHSGDHPESDWGAHTLQAARFGLAMLDAALPALAPFTPANTRVIAAGISNGGGAVLRAAGEDVEGLLDGVVAIEANVHVAGHGRALYDYATEAALWLPAALTAPRFEGVPFVHAVAAGNPGWPARRESLHAHGFLAETSADAQATAALAHLRGAGWTDAALATAALTTSFDLWRSLGATYTSAYLGTRVGHMPFGLSFQRVEVNGRTAAAVRAAWWSDGAGIPPEPGIMLTGATAASPDPALPGILAARRLWTGEDPGSATLHASIDRIAARLPRADLPIWVLHGAEDGLLPAAFTSDPYVAWLRANGRDPRYWRVPHAQHFDAFLNLPGYGDRYVPLLPYGYAALDAMYAHVVRGAPLPDRPVPDARPRGPDALDPARLALPG